MLSSGACVGLLRYKRHSIQLGETSILLENSQKPDTNQNLLLVDKLILRIFYHKTTPYTFTLSTAYYSMLSAYDHQRFYIWRELSFGCCELRIYEIKYIETVFAVSNWKIHLTGHKRFIQFYFSS